MIKKIINFGLVGVFATAIEYILLIVLKEFFNVDVIIASGIAFTVSLLFNYVLSIKYVFVDKKEMSKTKEMTGFFITAIKGYIYGNCYDMEFYIKTRIFGGIV